MSITKKHILAGLMLATTALIAPAHAAASKSLTLAVISDMSGLYKDAGGPGSVVAVNMAIKDSGIEKQGWSVKVIGLDHQNKPDVGANLARQAIDQDHADAIIDVPNSAVALAISPIVQEKNKVFLIDGAAADILTGAKCSPNQVHFATDTWALAHGTGGAITKAGGKTWFFITADYAFGKSLEKNTGAVAIANGGKVLGHVRAPLSTPDFSSFLLQAQASKAQVIGLANAGGDTINSMKQGAEFGIQKGGQIMAPLLLFITDVNSLGLKTAQGLEFTSSFYWDLNDQTRAFSKRYQALEPLKHMPTWDQAAVYSSTLQYLKAVEKLGDASDGKKVVTEMKSFPTDDAVFGKGQIRADGRAVFPTYLFKVKSPAESKGPWDYYKLIAKIPADQAFRPMKDGHCPYVK